jgi:hypothetical protein
VNQVVGRLSKPSWTGWKPVLLSYRRARKTVSCQMGFHDSGRARLLPSRVRMRSGGTPGVFDSGVPTFRPPPSVTDASARTCVCGGDARGDVANCLAASTCDDVGVKLRRTRLAQLMKSRLSNSVAQLVSPVCAIACRLMPRAGGTQCQMLVLTGWTNLYMWVILRSLRWAWFPCVDSPRPRPSQSLRACHPARFIIGGTLRHPSQAIT